MEKEKVNYLAIILAFCVVIAGLGGFWIGTYFGEKDDSTETTKNNETDKEDILSEADTTKLLKFIGINDKNEIDNNYYESLNDSLISYYINQSSDDAEIIIYNYAKDNGLIKTITDVSMIMLDDGEEEYSAVTFNDLDVIAKKYNIDNSILENIPELESSKDYYIFSWYFGRDEEYEVQCTHNVKEIVKKDNIITIKDHLSINYIEINEKEEIDIIYTIEDSNGEYSIKDIKKI